jgi:multiple sugar transport system ATP-binding protein
MLGIEPLLDRKPKQLSGGQRQRVALGRAIVREPAVFLMDEPLSNLDAKLRVQTRAEISKLHQRLATTFIYVTHDQVEAMTMGSRICVLRDGLMMQIDSPQNLYDLPDNVFVAGFIGSPSMNFFDTTVVEQDGDLYVDAGSFRLKLPPEKAPELQPYSGKEVVFGVRPEDIHDRALVPPGIRTEPLTATVDVTELMGNEIFVYMMTGQKEFIARMDPRTQAQVGNEIDVVVNMDNIHLFDRDTEQAIR